MKKLSEVLIAYLYPEEMNIYGDRGNVIALSKRLEWLGFKPVIQEVSVGDKFDFTKADIVFAGGGQDRGQLMVAEDLAKRKDNLKKAAESGVVMLTICGTYQLFGRGFTTIQEDKLPGVGIFDSYTTASNKRMIGNIVVQTAFGDLVGFENHSGQTELSKNQKPLGRVKKGYGNNFYSSYEGAITNNVFGSYLHGPLLPKNPEFTDKLLMLALERKGQKANFSGLNNSLEIKAAKVAIKRPK
ncbi:MAG: glutamine amidotransferase [Candidatus Saccharimonadales bacterium]